MAVLLKKLTVPRTFCFETIQTLLFLLYLFIVLSVRTVSVKNADIIGMSSFCRGDASFPLTDSSSPNTEGAGAISIKEVF